MVDTYSCAICCDSGWVMVDGRYPTRCEHVAAQAKLSKLVKYGSDYSEKASKDSLSGAALQFLTSGCGDGESFGSGMLLGPTGTGKSFLASAVANSILQLDCKRVTFAGVPALLWAMQRAMARHEEERLDDIDKSLIEADLLVLDDLGAEKPSAWSSSVLYRVVSDRAGRGAAILVTANCKLDALQEQVGERVVDRLLGFCKGQPVILGGKSRRYGGR